MIFRQYESPLRAGAFCLMASDEKRSREPAYTSERYWPAAKIRYRRMLRHFQTFPPDLIVLATHQRDGVDRWLHTAVAEPVARRSGAMTLFVPRRGAGFVSRADGTVRLKKILIPVDSRPHPQIAIEKALSLARGLECYTGEFRLLHVGDPTTAPVLDLPLGCGWSYDCHETEGEVVSEILNAEEDWQPDLMVLATAGHEDFLDALRGSTNRARLTWRGLSRARHSSPPERENAFGGGSARAGWRNHANRCDPFRELVWEEVLCPLRLIFPNFGGGFSARG